MKPAHLQRFVGGDLGDPLRDLLQGLRGRSPRLKRRLAASELKRVDRRHEARLSSAGLAGAILGGGIGRGAKPPSERMGEASEGAVAACGRACEIAPSERGWGA